MNAETHLQYRVRYAALEGYEMLKGDLKSDLFALCGELDELRREPACGSCDERVQVIMQRSRVEHQALIRKVKREKVRMLYKDEVEAMSGRLKHDPNALPMLGIEHRLAAEELMRWMNAEFLEKTQWLILQVARQHYRYEEARLRYLPIPSLSLEG